MKTKLTLNILSVLLILSVVLAACAPQEVIRTVEVGREVVTTVEVEVEKEVVETVVVEKEVVIQVTPTPQPTTRNGAWIDTIIFTEQGSDAAVTQLKVGELDVYAYSVGNATLFQNVKDSPELAYTNSFGSYNELTFNPAEFSDGRLNPFTNPKIREAMNWLVDRDYIAQEIMGGLAVPKLTAFNSAFPEYARYVDVVRALESKYAYNPEKANEVITAELEGMGASLSGGVWTFNGEPITIIVLIRTEDERRIIGDYVGTQLESIGFTVDRQYKTSSEASPIWVRGNPTDGLFHVYTGGWITTSITRNDGDNFSFFYTPRDYPIPLWQTYTPSEEFDAVALKLRNNDYKTMDERRELFSQALPLSLEDSVRVWLVDRLSFSPVRNNVVVAYDLAGGISGSQLYALTGRFAGQEGGTMKIAQPQILVDPWNPVGGSNWIYDMMPIRATMDRATITDPYTGLAWPQRIEKAEIVAQEGLPISVSLDWVTLEFAPTIEVPGDAWADWDPVNQKWITVSEKFAEPQTAQFKSTVYYPADLWDVQWHDGSNLSIGDFMMAMIMGFDTGKEESALYDESAASSLEAFLAHFKGVKIISTDPLIIETYDDVWQLDAELMVYTWWPETGYSYGPGAWHNIAVGNLAEAEKTLAYSADKADVEEVEWMSFISGPSLEILKGYLDTAAAENLIPFAPTMSEYVTADEATARWANLVDWYGRYGHFWLGTGPFYLYKVFPVEGTIMLQRYAGFPDLANKWDRFGEPPVAEVDVDGPGQVTIGSEVTFDVYITFKDQPYPTKDINEVKFLLFDATGALVASGEAVAVADGQYQVVLTAEMTQALQAGAVKLEIAVSSLVVSIPSFATFEFVAVP